MSDMKYVWIGLVVFLAIIWSADGLAHLTIFSLNEFLATFLFACVIYGAFIVKALRSS